MGQSGAALYIDVDGDGACDPSVDELFVWEASTINGDYNLELSLTPESPHCLEPSLSERVLEAAQRLCPAVGSCFGFCGSSNLSPAVAGSPLLCSAEDAGTDANVPTSPEDGGTDADVSTGNNNDL